MYVPALYIRLLKAVIGGNHVLNDYDSFRVGVSRGVQFPERGFVTYWVCCVYWFCFAEMVIFVCLPLGIH